MEKAGASGEKLTSIARKHSGTAHGQIKALKLSILSPMPEGLADTLTKEQLRDLITFLLKKPAEKRP